VKPSLPGRAAPGFLTTGLLLLAVGGCGSEGTPPPLPACSSAPGGAGTTVADTLDSDIIFPDDAPPGVAAAALSVTTRGVYQVCAAADTERIEFDASTTPHGRAWLRVTTRRPVRARLDLGDESGGPTVVVLPGTSNRTGPAGESP
jgi:hypothetical protein